MTKELKNNVVSNFLRLNSHPGVTEPEPVVCAGGSGARFSTLGAGEGAGESLELALARSDPLSLENFT